MVSFQRAIAWCALVLLPGCIVDRDAPCGPNQELSELGTCACVSGMELDSAKDTCVPVEEAPAGLGEACDEEECGGAEFPRCQASEAGDYCTSEGCTSSDECGGEYACNTTGEVSYCERPPVGQGAACASEDDCDGEATYCESAFSNVCLVANCELDGCFEGYTCCDLSSFGVEETLCVPEGECPT